MAIEETSIVVEVGLEVEEAGEMIVVIEVVNLNENIEVQEMIEVRRRHFEMTEAVTEIAGNVIILEVADNHLPKVEVAHQIMALGSLAMVHQVWT